MGTMERQKWKREREKWLYEINFRIEYNCYAGRVFLSKYRCLKTAWIEFSDSFFSAPLNIEFRFCFFCFRLLHTVSFLSLRCVELRVSCLLLRKIQLWRTKQPIWVWVAMFYSIFNVVVVVYVSYSACDCLGFIYDLIMNVVICILELFFHCIFGFRWWFLFYDPHKLQFQSD